MEKQYFPVFSGNIEIKKTASLEKLASSVGEALGGISLSWDSSGRFEEFPAFVGEAMGFRIALLGDPSPEEDLREDRGDGYQLQITSTNSPPAGSDLRQVNIAFFYVTLLMSRGINCRPLS